MQRWTTWDQSISSGFTPGFGWPASGAIVLPPCIGPAACTLGAPIPGASMVRRNGRARVPGDRLLLLVGDASPIPFQLNVPTHCIVC